MRRRGFLAAGVLGVLFGGISLAQERVVKITARKFEFVPSEITLKKGEPVVLELTSEDVTMGFYAKELGLSTEFPPGKPTLLRFTPDRAGEFEFICDVFCGEGHEDMGGKIRVAA